MVDSKDGKPLVGLYYKPIAVSGYCGENTPGFPKTIYWNNQYVISQNYDGKSPDIIEYVIFYSLFAPLMRLLKNHPMSYNKNILY